MQRATGAKTGNTDFDTLGGRISRARDGLNLSTAQLARRLGVKSNTVNDWETDRSEPRANRVTMLAGVLGVSPTWLLTGIGESPAAPEVHSELRVLMTQIARLRDSHDDMSKTIETLELEAERIAGALSR